jgi:hypothetical protein
VGCHQLFDEGAAGRVQGFEQAICKQAPVILGGLDFRHLPSGVIRPGSEEDVHFSILRGNCTIRKMLPPTMPLSGAPGTAERRASEQKMMWGISALRASSTERSRLMASLRFCGAPDSSQYICTRGQ